MLCQKPHLCQISSGCQLPVFLALGRMVTPLYSHPSTAQPQGPTELLCACSSSSSCPAGCGLHKVWQVWRYSQLRPTELAGTQRIGSQLFLPKVEITHFAARRTNTKQKRKAAEKKKNKISLALAFPEFPVLQTNYPVTAWEIPENVNRNLPQ